MVLSRNVKEKEKRKKTKKDREIVKEWADTNGLFLSTVAPPLPQLLLHDSL
jgi:hypothetical protein